MNTHLTALPVTVALVADFSVSVFGLIDLLRLTLVDSVRNEEGLVVTCLGAPVGALASLLPAMRASSVDAAVGLKGE
jgi:hypothetical protein